MQSSRRTLLILIAALIAAFTALSVRGRLAEAPVAQQAVQATPKVIVAARDLAPGTFVQPQDLGWGEAPPGPAEATLSTPDNTYLREGTVNITDFNGAVVRRQLRAGDPIPQSAMMKSGEGGFMSAVLEPGMRAVSIAVNATSGNAGFVSPGDRIDLVVTHHFKMRSTDSSPGVTPDDSIVSETFVRNVRVVAVDQMLDNPENKAILAKTVTVEVTPRQVEQIAVATDMGKISVALRSLVPARKETAQEQPDSPEARVLTDLYGEQVPGDFTRDTDVSQLVGHKAVPRVQVIRGDTTTNLEFMETP